MKKIGSPPQTVAEWLEDFAFDNEDAARSVVWPFTIKYKAHARAFRVAADMVRRADSGDATGLGDQPAAPGDTRRGEP